MPEQLESRSMAPFGLVWLILCLTSLLSGCPRPADSPDMTSLSSGAERETAHTDEAVSALRFREVAESFGVDFVYQNGEESGHFSILESLGGGVALLDADGDGDLDLFLPGGGQFGPHQEIIGLAPALYENLGEWRFRDVTDAAAAKQAPYYSHGVAAADYDNDGFTDMLVTGYGGLLLLQNQGDGTFSDMTEPAGLSDNQWSSSAAWGDFNGDGSLDLYVAHYVNWSFDNHPFCEGPEPGQREVCPPREFDPLPDTLYLSNGDGTFRDASQAAGLQPAGPDAGKGLGVFAADVDVDGHVDVYVGNDTVPNFLYRNDGGGSFEDVSLVSGTSLSDKGVPDGSMGVDLGDYNLDGLPDIWVANYERESFGLYRNNGNCVFQSVSQTVGVTAVGGLYVGWGTVFADFDLDADEDIAVSNGHVVRYPLNAPLRQKPLLFQNKDGVRFVDVAASAGRYFASPHMGRGLARGDIDDDGDVDLAVSHTNEPVALLSNETAQANHWLSLQLIGADSSRTPIGALVTVQTGDSRQVRQLTGGASYASTNDSRLHFGLGPIATPLEVHVRWPSGATQVFDGARTDHRWALVEGRAAPLLLR